jgi:hypothetical protein
MSLRYNYFMQRMRAVVYVLLLTVSALGQGKRLWVLRAPDEIVEYDPATFAVKQTVKVPAEAVQSPQSIAVNRLGQILFAPAVSLPLADTEATSPHKAWLWNGHSAATIDLGVKRETAATGSNQAITESAPTIFLSADGGHLFWFGNQARRLQREGVDLSVTTTWQAWKTNLSGAGREDLASMKLPDCRCPTGACEETCPYGVGWVPGGGVEKFFVMTQVVAGKDETSYKASTCYQGGGGKWTATPLAEPLQRALDATPGGEMILEAIPDTGCCGWSNQSNDQTLVLEKGKTRTVFDEWAQYKNEDYDVSFFNSNAQLSPELGSVAMTIAATAKPNQPIQLSEHGQANPDESRQIRKALAELPAVEVESMDESLRRIAFLPHAAMVGWISEKELLIVEDHLLIGYKVATGARRKSSVRVEDAARVFLR